MTLQQSRKQNETFTTEIGEYIMFKSGNESSIFGVPFMVRKIYKQVIIKFQSIFKEICYVRLRGRFRKISLNNVYAPTEMKEEEEKDQFYEEIVNLPKYDIKIYLGDLNAKVGICVLCITILQDATLTEMVRT